MCLCKVWYLAGFSGSIYTVFRLDGVSMTESKRQYGRAWGCTGDARREMPYRILGSYFQNSEEYI